MNTRFKELMNTPQRGSRPSYDVIFVVSTESAHVSYILFSVVMRDDVTFLESEWCYIGHMTTLENTTQVPYSGKTFANHK